MNHLFQRIAGDHHFHTFNFKIKNVNLARLCARYCLGDEWSPLRALNACGQILQKKSRQGPDPPILAMPVFWEVLGGQPLPSRKYMESTKGILKVYSFNRVA